MSKFCTNCGTKLEDNVKFCTSCGKSVEEEGQAQSYNSQVVVNNNGANQPTNGLAIAGFVVSLVSLCCCGLGAIVGLILSIIGLVKAKDYNGNGKGLAIAGVIISAISILFLIFYIIFSAAWPSISSQIEEEWSSADEVFIVR